MKLDIETIDKFDELRACDPADPFSVTDLHDFVLNRFR
jgi:hypothetical protein